MFYCIAKRVPNQFEVRPIQKIFYVFENCATRPRYKTSPLCTPWPRESLPAKDRQKSRAHAAERASRNPPITGGI